MAITLLHGVGLLLAIYELRCVVACTLASVGGGELVSSEAQAITFIGCSSRIFLRRIIYKLRPAWRGRTAHFRGKEHVNSGARKNKMGRPQDGFRCVTTPAERSRRGS